MCKCVFYCPIINFTFILVGSVVPWLEHRNYDQHDLGSKPTLAIYSFIFLEKTLHGIFPYLAVLTSSSKFQSYLYKTKKTK